jgi:hypothetical protein
MYVQHGPLTSHGELASHDFNRFDRNKHDFTAAKPVKRLDDELEALGLGCEPYSHASHTR